jgi:hypothetical protein
LFSNNARRSEASDLEPRTFQSLYIPAHFFPRFGTSIVGIQMTGAREVSELFMARSECLSGQIGTLIQASGDYRTETEM